MHFRSILHAHDTKNYYLRLNIQMSSNLISNSTVFFTCFYNRKCTTNFFAKNKVQFLYYVCTYEFEHIHTAVHFAEHDQNIFDDM